MEPLTIGEAAPDFLLENQDGEPVALSSFKGQYLIMWWYPVADTPGRTIEGKGFRDRIQDYQNNNAVSYTHLTLPTIYSV